METIAFTADAFFVLCPSLLFLSSSFSFPRSLFAASCGDGGAGATAASVFVPHGGYGGSCSFSFLSAVKTLSKLPSFE